MNLRPGLCIAENGQPEKIFWTHSRSKISPVFFLSPDPTGHLSLAYVQGHFFSVTLDYHRGRWMTTEQWLHCVRREAIERQKEKPWRYRYEKWDNVKVMVLPRTDPDGLVVDSNTAIILGRKEQEFSGTRVLPGTVIHRGGRQIDCDYAALAHIIGAGPAKECFKKHNREIPS